MTNETKHTLGRWTTLVHAAYEKGAIWGKEQGKDCYFKEHLAAAKLADAAPELLKLLEVILIQHKTDGAYSSWGEVSLSRAMQSRIEHAITKARWQL